MYHKHSILHVLVVLLLASGFFGFAPSVNAQELREVIEETRTRIFDQIDSFAIDPCDPPCPGLICCDNHVCVHSILACGFYPIHIDSFAFHGSESAQMAGFATQGVLAAELGREARLWFGQIDGEGWDALGIEPGLYEMVLLEGAVMDHAMVAVKDGDGREVARLEGHFWVFYGALSYAGASATEPDWTLSAESLQFLACNEGRCLQLDLDITEAG